MTTVRERAASLERTIASLRCAGFDSPLVFVDGRSGGGLLGAFGNWVVSLTELVVRFPTAQRYAMFQDDLAAVRGMREYLDATPWPHSGYFNLYAHPDNRTKCAARGWNLSDQSGKGALALVFDRATAIKLLTTPQLLERASHPTRGWRFIDGGVSDAMRRHGVKEYFHFPSLVKHVGKVSTMSKAQDATKDSADRYTWPDGYEGVGFPGEQFDARGWLIRHHQQYQLPGATR